MQVWESDALAAEDEQVVVVVGRRAGDGRRQGEERRGGSDRRRGLQKAEGGRDGRRGRGGRRGRQWEESEGPGSVLVGAEARRGGKLKDGRRKRVARGLLLMLDGVNALLKMLLGVGDGKGGGERGAKIRGGLLVEV